MSWSIFYLEMQAHMVRQTIRHNLPPAGGVKGLIKFAINKKAEAIIDLQAFASAFCDAYDKTVKSGKTLMGGVPVGSGNKKIMKTVLIAKMLQAKNTGKKLDKTLLDLCGTAVLAYWGFASIAKSPVPTMPCYGSVKNLTTTQAYTLFPGKWTSIIVGPQNSFDPFLLSFIASAMLHNLTLAGIFICNCQYPPPAPPAPGVLAWVGYYVPPPGTGGSGLGVGSLVKSSINTKLTELTAKLNFYNGIKDFAYKNGLLILGIGATYAASKFWPKNSRRGGKKSKKQNLHDFLLTPQGKSELYKLQKEGISQQLAGELSAEISKSGVPIYEDVANNIDDSQLKQSPKTTAKQIKDGDIQNKVNKINNTTQQDVSNSKALQKNIAESFKTPSTGDVGKFIPKSIPQGTSILIKDSYTIAYDKIKSSTLTNLQRINLLDDITKIVSQGTPIENIDALIEQKQNNKTKG
jgi:hypothetical protein